MKNVRSNVSVRLLMTLNILLIGIVISLIVTGFNDKEPVNKLETNQLVIRNPGKSAYIQIGMVGEDPVFVMTDSKGNARVQLEGGDSPSIILRNKKNNIIAQINSLKDDSAVLILHDEKGGKRFQLQGGMRPGLYLTDKNNKVIANLSEGPGDGGVMVLRDSKQQPRLLFEGGNDPGIYLLNGENKTIGSIAQLNDGSGGIGLARKSGVAAAVVRGGTDPGIAFFTGDHNEPSAALGVAQQVPHLLIAGNIQKEGILIHGGKQSSMVMVDSIGNIKLLISKEGVFQEKERKEPPSLRKKKKFFTFEDQKTLFPDTEEEKASE